MVPHEPPSTISDAQLRHSPRSCVERRYRVNNSSFLKKIKRAIQLTDSPIWKILAEVIDFNLRNLLVNKAIGDGYRVLFIIEFEKVAIELNKQTDQWIELIGAYDLRTLDQAPLP